MSRLLQGATIACFAVAMAAATGTPQRHAPLGLDLYMPVPEENPLTVEKIEQGRRLFNDRRLSRDRSTACVSCHDPARAFSTAEPVSAGVFGRRGRRNAPALVNRGWGRSFFWDGRVRTLEEQVLKPIEDPNEMDLPVADAASRVGLPVEDLSRALASYVRSIMSGNSPYDRFVNGERTALSAEQQVGLQILSWQRQLHRVPRWPQLHRRAAAQHGRRVAQRPVDRPWRW